LKNTDRNDVKTPDQIAWVFYNETLEFVLLDYTIALILYESKALILYKSKALVLYKDENKALVFYFRLNKTYEFRFRNDVANPNPLAWVFYNETLEFVL
jgi:uncharacterized membrane protein